MLMLTVVHGMPQLWLLGPTQLFRPECVLIIGIPRTNPFSSPVI